MNRNDHSQTTIFQDRNLIHETPVITPYDSWKRLCEGDERAEFCEGVLRAALVVSMLCAMVICGLRLSLSQQTQDDNNRLAMPSVHLPQMCEQAPAAAIKAAF